jgi:hypothetical protein
MQTKPKFLGTPADAQTKRRLGDTLAAGVLEPQFISIKNAATYSNRSEWVIKDELRRRLYEAVKAGRRTLIVFAGFKRYLAQFPAAKFAPPRERTALAATARRSSQRS